MPLYVADYRADTAHLSAAQHGAYLLLIMHYWTTGGLPVADDALARISCMTTAEWRKSRSVVAAFFSPEWKHKRIDAELKRTSEVSKAYASRASQAAHKRWSKDAPSNASSIPQAMPDESLDMPISHSQRKKEEDTATAVPPSAAPYAFESGVIRLTPKDFNRWKEAFSHLDLSAELVGLTEWAGTQGQKWFHAVSGALAKRNREAGIRIEQAKNGTGEFKWRSGMEGIV